MIMWKKTFRENMLIRLKQEKSYNLPIVGSIGFAITAILKKKPNEQKYQTTKTHHLHKQLLITE